MNITGAQADSILTELNVMVTFEWITITLFIIFLVGMAITGLNAWKGIQSFRSRRINPLLQESRTLAQNGAAVAKLLAARGKSIVDVSLSTADTVGLRAQTTANVVKGTIPEARRLPGEVAATTSDIQSSVKTAQSVRTAMHAARSAQAVAGAARSVGSLLSAIGSRNRSTPAE